MPLEEFHGPFSSWTQVFASGDTTGATDWTNIQNALNVITPGRNPNSSPVLYLNAGHYYINQSLMLGAGAPSGQLVGVIGPMIVGHSRFDTTITWAGGTPNGTGVANRAIMFVHNGVSQMMLRRITFDGANVAMVAYMDCWRNLQNPNIAPNQSYFPTANRLEDIGFRNLNINGGQSGPQSETLGMALGVAGYGASETQIFRCSFNYPGNAFGVGNIVGGAMTYNFNSLDNWFWDCEFVGMQRGVMNQNEQDNYSGDFTAQRCHFQTTESELTFGNLAPNFGSRWCYSAPGSWRHWEGGAIGGFISNVTVQGCTIGPKAAEIVGLSNAGPVLLLDNVIGSHGTGAAQGCAIFAQEAYGTNNGAGAEAGIGNKYADPQSSAYFTSATTTVHSVDDQFGVGYTDPGLPAMAPEPPAVTRTVIEAGGGLQAAINQAFAEWDGVNPIVVHINSGTQTVSSTVTVPANFPVCIEGDSVYYSKIQWTGGGAGPVIQFNLPSLALVRNLQVDGGGTADCFVASGPSNGGVVHMEGCVNSTVGFGGVRAVNMGSTTVDMMSCLISTNSVSDIGYGVSSEGSSVVHWVTGATGNGWGPFYQVLQGGTLVACNVYAENGTRTSTIVAPNSTGTLNIDGGRTVGGNVVFDLSTFNGLNTVTNHYLAESCTSAPVLGDNTLLLGLTFGSPLHQPDQQSVVLNNPPYSVGSSTQYAVLSPYQQQDPSGQAFPLVEQSTGVSDVSGYIRTHLAPLRAVKPVDLVANVPNGNTQLMFINVYTNNEHIAFTFSSTGSSGTVNAIEPAARTGGNVAAFTSLGGVGGGINFTTLPSFTFGRGPLPPTATAVRADAYPSATFASSEFGDGLFGAGFFANTSAQGAFAGFPQFGSGTFGDIGPWWGQFNAISILELASPKFLATGSGGTSQIILEPATWTTVRAAPGLTVATGATSVTSPATWGVGFISPLYVVDADWKLPTTGLTWGLDSAGAVFTVSASTNTAFAVEPPTWGVVRAQAPSLVLDMKNGIYTFQSVAADPKLAPSGAFVSTNVPDGPVQVRVLGGNQLITNANVNGLTWGFVSISPLDNVSAGAFPTSALTWEASNSALLNSHIFIVVNQTVVWVPFGVALAAGIENFLALPWQIAQMGKGNRAQNDTPGLVTPATFTQPTRKTEPTFDQFTGEASPKEQG